MTLTSDLDFVLHYCIDTPGGVTTTQQNGLFLPPTPDSTGFLTLYLNRLDDAKRRITGILLEICQAQNYACLLCKHSTKQFKYCGAFSEAFISFNHLVFLTLQAYLGI